MLDTTDTADTTPPDEPITRAVPTSALDKLRKELAALHRRAARAGHDAPAPELVVEATEIRRRCSEGCGFVEVRDNNTRCRGCGSTSYPVEVAIVRLAAPPPVVAGWEFVAAIEPWSPIGNMIRRMPGAAPDVSLEAYRSADVADRCEHCRVSRRRSQTFVLRATGDGASPPGTLLQVGRSCLHAHLGEDPDDVLARLRWADLLRDASYGGGADWEPELTDLDYYAACVVAVIQLDGWVSGAVAREAVVDSTARIAWRVANPRKGDTPDEIAWRARRQPTATQREIAAAAIAAALGSTEETEFAVNLRVACSYPYLTRRVIGYVAAAVNAECRRRVAATEAAAVATAGRAPAHVGTVGERLRDVAVTVVDVRIMAGRFTSTLLKLVTDAGDAISWFASGELLISDYQGKRGRLTATIKAHTEFRGRPETQVTRAKLVIDAPATEAETEAA